jgi:hypothetical protein
MSFNQKTNGTGYAPGHFLASADCDRETVQVSASHSQVVTRADGSKYVPAGAVIPSNDGNAKGLLYEDVDVSTGAMPGSLVTRGVVYEDKLPAAIESAAEAVLPGIRVITTTPAVVRPSSFNGGSLTALTVSSVSGTGDGKTDVSFSGYTPAAGERTVYKIHATVAPAAAYGQILPVGSGEGDWTAATFPLDELASTDGYKITVAVVDSTNAVVAAGSTTIDVK